MLFQVSSLLVYMERQAFYLLQKRKIDATVEDMQNHVKSTMGKCVVTLIIHRAPRHLPGNVLLIREIKVELGKSCSLTKEQILVSASQLLKL